MDIQQIVKQVEGIEAAIESLAVKAKEEFESAGSVATETNAQIIALGEKQLEIGKAMAEQAERLSFVEQSAGQPAGTVGEKTLGGEFCNSDQYKAYINGSTGKARMEIQMNTLTGSDANVAPDRKGGIVQGDFRFLTLEDLFVHIPTTSNAIEYTKEASFTDNAAEAAEAAEKGESALTWSLVTEPLSTVAHWIKISKQLAADNVALAAYVNRRMIYGVNRRVEDQLGAGDGIAPNIGGLLLAGNFTAHGFADAALGTLKKVNLITKIVGSLWVAGGRPNAVLLNPVDWAQVQVDLTDSTANSARVDWSNPIGPRINGLLVVQSGGITADNIVVLDTNEAGPIYDREAVSIEMSDSDDDNFTKNLITIRAERRLCLTVERPSMVIAGDLTPV